MPEIENRVPSVSGYRPASAHHLRSFWFFRDIQNEETWRICAGNYCALYSETLILPLMISALA